MRLRPCCPALHGIATTGVHANCDMGGCIARSRKEPAAQHAANVLFWHPVEPLPFLGDLEVGNEPETLLALDPEPETNRPWDLFDPPEWLPIACVFFVCAAAIAYGMYRTRTYLIFLPPF